MTSDSRARRRLHWPATVAIAIVAIGAICVVLLLTHKKDDDPGRPTSVTAAELDQAGAESIWKQLVAARDDCNEAQINGLAMPSYINAWLAQSGADSIAEACTNQRSHERFRSTSTTTSADVTGFTGGVQPTLQITYQIARQDLTGNQLPPTSAVMDVTFVRGDDGYWRVSTTSTTPSG